MPLNHQPPAPDILPLALGAVSALLFLLILAAGVLLGRFLAMRQSEQQGVAAILARRLRVMHGLDVSMLTVRDWYWLLDGLVSELNRAARKKRRRGWWRRKAWARASRRAESLREKYHW